MNSYIETQITNMVTMTKTFQQSCRMAALKNDGKIDKEEERQLKKIDAAAIKFIETLQKISKK